MSAVCQILKVFAVSEQLNFYVICESTAVMQYAKKNCLSSDVVR